MAYEACGLSFGRPIRSESETFNVCMGSCAIVAALALDLGDIDHCADVKI